MSQEKVDRYKKEKANRKQIAKKQKIENFLRKCLVGAVGLVLVGWIGYSAYGTYESKKPHEKIEVNYTALADFYQKLSEVPEEPAE